VNEALLYEQLSEGRVRCRLCGHECLLADGKRGICQVRENRGGKLETLVYGRSIARQVDPIEKKPLYHVYPGSRSYSIATPGCNFHCRWCQNWQISQMPRERGMIAGQAVTPQEIVVDASRKRCRTIAYTYTEPTVYFEHAYETAKLAHEAGIANVFVTNGHMSREMLETINPYLDAANVDLKAFRDDTYRKFIGASLQPVLDSLKTMKRFGVWLEVTMLVIPGINDGSEELRDAAQFVARELGAETPWHLSRFFPAYQMTDVPPTPHSTLRRALEIGQEAGLHYVYLGNVSDEVDTVCHACGQLLIRRSRFAVLQNRVESGSRCPDCHATVAGLGMDATSSQ
jgi:pyruvate formate lyase activating enzyme